MYRSVIAGYSRSPFTMAKKGALVDAKPVNLLADVIKNLQERDTKDSSRKDSPLIISDDAIVIDTSDLEIDEQASQIINLVEQKFS